MGADLYIKDLDRQNQYRGFEVSKNAVEAGYFRDCYNDYGLFSYLRSNTGKEYSWWQFADKKNWFEEDDEGRLMTESGTRAFLAKMKEAKKIISGKKTRTIDVLNIGKGGLTREKKRLTAKEVREFDEWLDLLLEFLELAIKTNSKIIWSV